MPVLPLNIGHLRSLGTTTTHFVIVVLASADAELLTEAEGTEAEGTEAAALGPA